jgi:hypothetical protein
MSTTAPIRNISAATFTPLLSPVPKPRPEDVSWESFRHIIGLYEALGAHGAYESWNQHSSVLDHLDWKQLLDSANALLKLVKDWRLGLPTHLAWDDDAAVSHGATHMSLASLRAHFYEAVSVVLRPYVDIVLCHCRERSLSEIPPEYMDIIEKSLGTMINSIEVSNTLVVLNPVGSYHT